MEYKEAIEWLDGIRDMINIVPQDPIDTLAVRTEQANAAKIQQAYWVLKAHKDGLITGTGEKSTGITNQCRRRQKAAAPDFIR